MKKNNDLIKTISLLKDDLQTALLDKEKLSKLCSDSDEKVSELTKEYETAVTKIKELSFVEEKNIELVKKVDDMVADMQLQSNLLSSKETEVKELCQLKLKYDECLIQMKEHEETLHSLSNELKIKDMKIQELTTSEERLSESMIKIEELESDLSSKNELLLSKDMKIQELTTSEERLGEALIKIEELESNLSSKNELLISKELCIEKTNNIKQNYDSSVKKIKEMEDYIKEKSEILIEKEKKILDLTESLEEKKLQLEKLEYENLEIKDRLEAEKESSKISKICIECEELKDEVKEIDHLKRTLMDTEKELNKQKLQASQLTNMLRETEENFDNMRIKKEKEIIKCKDTIESLQHELKILKVEVREAEKIRYQNDKLHLTIEEIKLQNAGDIQRLQAEIKSLKPKDNIPSLNSDSSVLKKLMPATPTEKAKHDTKTGEIMEPDSSDEVTIIDEENSQPTLYKKFSKTINRKVMTHQMQQSTPRAHLEKRKRAWESESSGSECLEIIIDKNAKRISGLAPKTKSPHATNLISSQKLPTSQEGRTDMKNADMEIMPKKNLSNSNTATHFAIKSTPKKNKVEPINSSETINLQPSKINVQELSFTNSPWREQVMQRTPTTPADRKFFKTPLKERENPFKKPQLQKLWF